MEVNRSKFIYTFSVASQTTSGFFFRGEPVLALKSSSLRGNVLLSTALFVSGEVLMGACAKRGLIWAEFGKKFYFHGLQSAWDIIKSGKA